MYTVLSRIPPEVALDILGFLELWELARCLRVCREWHVFLISTPWLWNHLNLRHDRLLWCDATFEPYRYALKNYITWAGPHLRTLRLDFELSEAFGTLALQLVAANSCKQIERLELNNTSGPEEAPLMLRSLRNMGPVFTLTFLQLYCLEMTLHDIHTILFANFPSLQHLDLSDSYIYDDGALDSATVISVTDIRDLILSHIEGSSSSVFEYLLRSCPKLESLGCYSASPSYQVIRHLSSHHQSLATLGFGFVRHGQGGHQHLQTPSDMQLTTAVHSILLSRVDSAALMGAVVYGSAAALTSLSLYACTISDACFRSLAAASPWPQLRQLTLEIIYGLSDAGLCSLLRACTRLEQLVLRHMLPDLVVSDSMLRLFAALGSLVDITYEQPDHVTPTAIHCLVADKHKALNRAGEPRTLHLSFNTHTRISIHYPTHQSVDALLRFNG